MIITINMLQDNKSWAKVIDQTDVLHTIYDRNTERERENTLSIWDQILKKEKK